MNLRRLVGFTALLVNANCGGGQTPKTAPRALDLGPARATVQRFMEAHYAAIAKPDIAAYVGGMAPDVAWIGSSAGEELVGQVAVGKDMEAVFGPAIQAGGKFDLKSGGMKIGVAADGRAAWVADELTLTIAMGADNMVVPYRVTSFLGEAGGKWSILAQAWSVATPNEEAFAKAAQGQWPKLADWGGGAAKGGDALAKDFGDSMADSAAWVKSFSDSAEAFVFGSAPEETIEGGVAIKQVFGQMVAAYQVTLAVAGGVRAGVAPSGSAGFAGGNIGFTVDTEGQKITQPYRALLVYVKEGNAWRPVQAHFSNGQAAE
ncbi:MAG: nuclear transport factor 2 family protein [Caulobacteraceae bacterium]|nr:nuclear transport factor 2 family protein [Caulobacteraceae bacterium]